MPPLFAPLQKRIGSVGFIAFNPTLILREYQKTFPVEKSSPSVFFHILHQDSRFRSSTFDLSKIQNNHICDSSEEIRNNTRTTLFAINPNLILLPMHRAIL